MANLQISDEFGLNATLQIADNSPLAKASLTHLNSLDQSLKDQVAEPIDKCPLKEFSFGAQGTSPALDLSGVAKLKADGGVCGTVSVFHPSDKTLFPANNFSPEIAIAPTQCWMGVELALSVDAGVQATADGFGIGFKDANALKATTYTLIKAQAAKFPVMLDALKTALEGFRVAATSTALRELPIGTVCENELSGTVTFTGSYQLPVSINPLASADLPFNFKLAVTPAATVKLSGSIALSGDLVVRAFKVNDGTLEIGIYKKQGSTLTAGFNLGAGIGVALNTTDLAPIILSAAFPGVDCKAAGITGASAAGLNTALKGCIDRSLAISTNVACSAANQDEAAVIYRLDLNSGDAANTDAALKSALGGDWTLLSQLSNATRLRNIVTDTSEYKHTMAVNLFGIFNATEIGDYIQSCTVLCDEFGHIAVIDKSEANRVAVAATPYAADSNKLRNALAQDFLVTASYSVAASRINPRITAQQSYLFYDRNATRQEMRDQILLGEALGLIAGADQHGWDATLAANSVYPHAHVEASAKYDSAAVLSLFFDDNGQRRDSANLERAGRSAMIALIDQGDPGGPERLSALRNDATWNAMCEKGSVDAFGTLPALSGLPASVLDAIGADWTDIRWWADAMAQVSQKLEELQALLKDIPGDGFSTNPQFIGQTKAFQKLLGAIVKNTHAAFVGGWGIAVMSALAGNRAAKSLDVNWGSTSAHYEFGAAGVAQPENKIAAPAVVIAH